MEGYVGYTGPIGYTGMTGNYEQYLSELSLKRRSTNIDDIMRKIEQPKPSLIRRILAKL